MSAGVESTANEYEHVSKKQKEEKCTENGIKRLHENLHDLSSFKVRKVLSNNTNRKVVCLEGSFDCKEGVGLIVLEKTAFQDEDFTNEGGSDYFTEKSVLKKQFHNDIYGNYEFYPKADLNSVKTTIIHPATQKHIEKYSVQDLHIVDETPTIYNSIVEPHITNEQFDLQWVYNILDHKSESERIVFEDPDPEVGFILVPDLKWNGTSLDTLYLLAITHKRDIKSLRDLNGSYLSLLKNIREKGIKAIEAKYGLPGSQLRIYFHYQPSFYHLHVHFTYLRHEAPGITTERAHLLSTVISNIEICPDYYQKVTLSYVIREKDGLFDKFEEKGIVKKLEKSA